MRLVVVFGPPAVGKMTVGREICARTGFKLLHNHMTIEPVLEIFPFGSPPFDRISGGLRRDVVREAAEFGLPGLVLTFVWGIELEGDAETVAEYDEIVRSRGGTVDYVELYADLEVRLERNVTAERLEHKRSKRDLEFSRKNLLDLEETFTLNTDPSGTGDTLADRFLVGQEHLRVETSQLQAAEVADRVVAELGILAEPELGGTAVRPA
ncbi:AAA family ATPase [Nocardioides sp. HDW12B]|uniref:AAA family ATPase n=1 Tax=Nocardioides sp. HDW12B TaxID=2714939 RepID=UPI00140E47BC|nr:AAA family ATPase [Nocardioides sp. HDW12B]QIK65364.1 AAA family ATPase [Nocardioides sp. HDW12B]